MWRLFTLAFLSGVILFGVAPSICAATASLNRGDCKKVLFIGNSLTLQNDLPEVFQEYVARAYPGGSACTQSYARYGASLRDLRNDGAAVDLIRGENWDAVILQPGREVLKGGGVKWGALLCISSRVYR